MTAAEIETVALRVVEILRAEREGAVRAALNGLALRMDDIAAHAESARDHVERLVQDRL